MSDQPKRGPVLNPTLREVQGTFPDATAVEDAVGRLTRAGFDRAQISLPVPGAATPEAGEDPIMADDARQFRTLGSSTAAAAGAMLGAGVTVLTGGAAAAAVAVAAAAGAAAGGGVLAATGARETARDEAHAARAAAGELRLAVTVQGDEDPARAAAILRDAGARDVKGG